MIVGREPELAAVDAFITSDADAPTALLLAGEPGVGKTLLWEHGVRRARTAGHDVLTARPAEAEQELPYAALTDLLAEVDPAVSGLPPFQASALEAALQRGEATAGSDQLAVSLALINLLTIIAAERTLVVAVDDLQWLDRPTARALAFAFRRARRCRLRFFASARPQPTPEALAVPAALERERIRLVTVEPLRLPHIGRMLRERLGLTLPPPALARVAELSGGNPLHALELARTLSPTARPGEPQALDDLLRHRVETLLPAPRRIAAAVAALGRPTVELLERLGPGLDDAVRAGVLELEGARVRFTHPLLATAAAGSLTDPQRRALHGALAEVADDPVERARQRALSVTQPDAGVAADLEAAAQVAAERGAPEAAAELAERAQLATPPAQEADLRRRAMLAARHHLTSGDGQQAHALLKRLTRELEPSSERAHAYLLLAEATGDLGASRGCLEQARRDARGNPGIRCIAHAALSVHAFVSGDLARAERHSLAAVRLARSTGDLTELAYALSDLGFVRFHRGHGLQRELAEEALTLLRGLPEAEYGGALTRPRVDFAVQLYSADLFEEARELLDAELADARRTGSLSSLTQTLMHVVHLELRAGHWSRADELSLELLEIAAGMHTSNFEGAALSVRALVEAHLGLVEDARAHALRGRELAAAMGDALFASANGRALGLLELSLNDAVAAHAALAPAAEALEASGIREPRALVTDAAEAAIGAGDTAAAEPLLARAEERARRTQRISALAAAARCRALLHAAEGKFDRALRAAEAALEQHALLDEPFERARTMLAYGTILRRAGERVSARRALAEAEEIFSGLGAAAWAERPRAEAARIGGRRAAGDELTPTEARVAVLVARGRTNKQTAAELFVTEKTVEANLSRIYRKLAVRSRTELAHLMANRGDPPDARGPGAA